MINSKRAQIRCFVDEYERQLVRRYEKKYDRYEKKYDENELSLEMAYFSSFVLLLW